MYMCQPVRPKVKQSLLGTVPAGWGVANSFAYPATSASNLAPTRSWMHTCQPAFPTKMHTCQPAFPTAASGRDVQHQRCWPWCASERTREILCFPSVAAAENYAVVVVSVDPIIGYCLRYRRWQTGDPRGMPLPMIELAEGDSW